MRVNNIIIKKGACYFYADFFSNELISFVNWIGVVGIRAFFGWIGTFPLFSCFLTHCMTIYSIQFRDGKSSMEINHHRLNRISPCNHWIKQVILLLSRGLFLILTKNEFNPNENDSLTWTIGSTHLVQVSWRLHVILIALQRIIWEISWHWQYSQFWSYNSTYSLLMTVFLRKFTLNDKIHINIRNNLNIYALFTVKQEF